MKKTPLKRGDKQMKRSGFKTPTFAEAIKKKRKYKKKTPVQKLQGSCDKLLSPIIRKMYPVCLFSGHEEEWGAENKCQHDTQVAHHHFKKSTSNACRYYIPNLIGLCTPCHLRLHHDEILWTGRVVEIKGLDWLRDLEEQKRKDVKISQTYYKEHLTRLEEIYDQA